MFPWPKKFLVSIIFLHQGQGLLKKSTRSVSRSLYLGVDLKRKKVLL